MKKFLLAALMLFTFAAHADECASNIAGLKNLVGNSAISMNWKENVKSDPLTLRLSNGAGNLRLKLTNPKGDWADVTGIICKKGDNYEARVNNIVWGPAAPGAVKGRKISTMSIKLPYHSLMKVSIKVLLINFGFEFSAI